MNSMDINYEITSYFTQIVGENCYHQQIGNDRSLFLRFGKNIQIESALGSHVHGMWEIGTYRGTWRVICDGTIVCGSKNAVDSIEDLRNAINQVNFGQFKAIHKLSEFDVRFEFSNKVFVDILCAFGDDDELLHTFFPNDIVISFSIANGWAIERSDKR